MNEKFLKPYDFKGTEAHIYHTWLQSGLFNPEESVRQGYTREDAEPFSIVLPPPNVTGTLHMGHAAMLAIEDILVRYARMKGKRTLWLPGTDHAAIATQSRVEKDLQKAEGKNRHDLGREEFLSRVRTFAQASHDTILSQVKAMGASVDWSREAFTLDEKRGRAVYTAFKNMYDAGLIYRGERIVNWDPKGQTVISDDEIVYEERDAMLYTFKYAPDFPIAISTTRPETKVGDTAVAVHPDDERYRAYVGKEYDLTFCDVPLHIKVIADQSVDPAFGTGALGVTPAHSVIDWEIADRHDLPRPKIINEYAKMTIEGRLAQQKTAEARDMVVEWLRSEGLLEKEEKIKQNVSTAERTGGIIEPMPKLQWFIAVNKEVPGRGKTLKQLMLEPVQNGSITILPDHFEKIYFHWIENLRDWCISRQIWYGHRIPVWYKGDDVYCGTEAPQGVGWVQDEDTLDTWFSSGLWTFSTLGWPEKTEDLATYHPTAVLETGYDILFFWVARMILMSQFHMETIPFKTVYLHGLVRDAKGRKMSKSLGNIIDPLEMIEKYGADAVRLSLIMGAAPGNDIKLSEDRIKGYKHFANKIWNISRFVLENIEGVPDATLTSADTALVEEAHTIAQEISGHIDSFRLDLAADAAYHYVWDRFAAVILEESKPILKEGSVDEQASRKAALLAILKVSLAFLHPFMPYVTEEIWSEVPGEKAPLLLVEKWPA